MDEQLYIVFENYLSSEMPNEERLAFENRLQNDADVREKFEIYKNWTNFLENKFDPETTAFKQNLKSISKQHFAENKQKPKVVSMKPWYYAVAASVVIALGIWFLGSENPQYGDFQHEKAYFTERSSSDKNLMEAQKFFNEKNYQKAVIAFEDSDSLSNPEVLYFYSIALVETDNYKAAELYLNNLKSGTSAYKYKAVWYLALSNLKQEKIDECKKYLNQIPADSEDYEKAQKLLQDLD